MARQTISAARATAEQSILNSLTVFTTSAVAEQETTRLTDVAFLLMAKDAYVANVKHNIGTPTLVTMGKALKAQYPGLSKDAYFVSPDSWTHTIMAGEILHRDLSDVTLTAREVKGLCTRACRALGDGGTEQVRAVIREDRKATAQSIITSLEALIVAAREAKAEQAAAEQAEALEALEGDGEAVVLTPDQEAAALVDRLAGLVVKGATLDTARLALLQEVIAMAASKDASDL